ncbi:MAG: dihydrofolate reductase family protein [Chloroflexota bacterium]
MTDMSVTLDGFVGRPDGSDPGLHNWVFGGSVPLTMGGFTFHLTSVSSAEFFREFIHNAGAVIVGNGSFKGIGESALFQLPTFVLTHESRPSFVQDDVAITFICDGIKSALKKAQAAAGDKAVYIFGGASTVQQYLNAGLLDEIQITVVPMLIGDGIRLFDHLEPAQIELESTQMIAGVGITHLKYRVVK